MNILLLFLFFLSAKTDPIKPILKLPQNITFADTRRIMGGHVVADTRPYMVYLRPATTAESKTNWLCGGVIIHERFIVTSAACIEDTEQFYVVSGTHKWVPPGQNDNLCVNYGAKRAIWKFVPKTYYFDGNEFDNIRWMIKDIAVVKVENDFNFMKRVRGCDFIPKMIAFNNVSEELEKPKTVASIAGWGSIERYSDVAEKETMNSPQLLEADVELITQKSCKERWDTHYHHIIEENMICAKDSKDSDAMKTMCSEQGDVKCKELVYSEDKDGDARRYVIDPKFMRVHNASHGPINVTRRTKIISGGFCENDHGGPLIVGRGKSAILVGVISACQTMDLTHKCYGPFLFTSVYKNRHIINCAIAMEMEENCRILLRRTKTHIVGTSFNWSGQQYSDLPPTSTLATPNKSHHPEMKNAG